MRGRIRLLGYVRDEIWRRAACPGRCDDESPCRRARSLASRVRRHLFINLRVLRDARDISVYLCGTARTTFGFPRPISRDVVKDLSKGEYTWRMSDDGITAILWHDNVPTQFLSNFHNPEEESSVFGRTKGERQRQACSAPQVGSITTSTWVA